MQASPTRKWKLLTSQDWISGLSGKYPRSRKQGTGQGEEVDNASSSSADHRERLTFKMTIRLGTKGLA